MSDQAKLLRRLVRRSDKASSADDRPAPRMLLVTAGRSGVGTTTVAVNLAVALARRKQRTVLIDAGPTGGNAASLCGLPDRYSVADVLAGRIRLGDALQAGPTGLRVLAGAWAAGNLAESTDVDLQRLVDQLLDLEKLSDAVVVDGAAGPNRLLGRLWRAAGKVLVVTTTETDSILDAYASVKVLADGRNSGRIHLLVNSAAGASAAKSVHRRMAVACRRLLGVELAGMSWLGRDLRIADAAEAGEPFVLARPSCRSTWRLHAIARELIPRPTRKQASPEGAKRHVDRPHHRAVPPFHFPVVGIQNPVSGAHNG